MLYILYTANVWVFQMICNIKLLNEILILDRKKTRLEL